jgi:hypothetical protein
MRVNITLKAAQSYPAMFSFFKKGLPDPAWSETRVSFILKQVCRAAGIPE